MLNPSSLIASTVEDNAGVDIPGPAKVERSKTIMNNMVATGQLTRQGAAWLKINTDPWHDTKIADFGGVPDNYGGQSVCCSVVQEINVSKPSALAAGNWQVRVSTNPMASPIISESYVLQGNTLGTNSAAPIVRWPIQIDFQSGSADFPAWGDANTLGLQIPETFQKGPFRVCAMGLEVVNTTSVLNKQGLATCAVMNQSTYEEFTLHAWKQAADPNYEPGFSASYYNSKEPPQNLSEMLLLPGTTQWEAAEGAYSVVQLHGFDKLPPGNKPCYPCFTKEDSLPTDTPREVKIPVAQLKTVTSGGLKAYFFPTNPGHIPMDTTVHMYTGLSDATTLTVRVRWVLQRFPNDNEPDIVVLTSPAPKYDPVALEIQSRVMRTLVPAVMFRLNPKGEWWKSMLATIADIASSGLMLMPHPLAQGAGAAIAAGRSWLLPNNPVQVKASKVKNVNLPAKRRQPKTQKGIKFITEEQVLADRKQKKAKKKKKKQNQA